MKKAQRRFTDCTLFIDLKSQRPGKSAILLKNGYRKAFFVQGNFARDGTQSCLTFFFFRVCAFHEKQNLFYFSDVVFSHIPRFKFSTYIISKILKKSKHMTNKLLSFFSL